MNITDSINHWHTYQAFNKTLYTTQNDNRIQEEVIQI